MNLILLQWVLKQPGGFKQRCFSLNIKQSDGLFLSGCFFDILSEKEVQTQYLKIISKKTTVNFAAIQT
jgi:hypothetical protein